MQGIIQLLPDHVANQIAAGEVVQRPASVVKELVENAVDAKATEIRLVVKDAGKTLIQVIDNGAGMNVTDARLCFERHATSKIKFAEDLFTLHTKGFRGEALASIAAVAHVELKSKQDQQELGTHIIIEGSKFISQEVAVLPKGTSFLVKNLFFNIPARRNFLKSDNIELKHIIDEFERVALAHPNIHFIMSHNGSETFNLPATNYRQRIVNIFGGKTNEKLIPVNEETAILTVSGFVGKPEFAKKNRTEQFFMVNDRFIKNGFLHHAVMNAFDGLLRENNQPSYFLYLKVPPHTLDINIHPTKTEVKFEDEHALYAILRSAIKHSLGMFNVAPVLDFDRDASLDTPYHLSATKTQMPSIQVDSSFNPFANDNSYKKPVFNTQFIASKNEKWSALYTQPDQQETTDFASILEQEVLTSSLFDDESLPTEPIIYQFNKKYIVKNVKSGLLFIHQSRAHQRILYEQFLTNITVQQANSQQLLFPLSINFSHKEMADLFELKPLLESIGFNFEVFTTHEMIILGIPTLLNESEVNGLLLDLTQNFSHEISEDSFSLTDKMAKILAKNIAIKTGKSLKNTEMEALINELFACKEPGFSPFNQKISITLSVNDIDKKL